MNRWLTAILGLGLLSGALVLPGEWYQPLPTAELAVPVPAISGLVVIRLALALLGLFCLAATAGLWDVPASDGFLEPRPLSGTDVSIGTTRWLLAALTVVGVVLRIYRLDTTLWIDEVTPLLAYRHASPVQILVSYISSNSHLMNVLLVKLATGWLGESDWVVRLPAVVFGMATPPLLYWAVRSAVSRRVALAGSFFLAVSYHHVFFSQNSRGYSAYMFFSIAAAGALTRALETDRIRYWFGYVVSMVLGFAAILLSGFVFVAHGAIGAVALVRLSRQEVFFTLFRRLGTVFLLIALLGFLIYAGALPQIYEYVNTVYVDPAAGLSLASLEFLLEMLRGLDAGIGATLLLAALPITLVGVLGFVELVRRSWVLISALVGPPALQMIFALASGLVVSPRFFILLLPATLLAGAQGIEWIVASVEQRNRYGGRIATAIFGTSAALVASISLAQLVDYYRTPKQAYAEAVTYIESTRTVEQHVVVVHVAEAGIRYYANRLGANIADYHFVRTLEDFNRSTRTDNCCLVVTTFHRALRIELPELAEQIDAQWSQARALPATIGEGQIVVWQRGAETHSPRLP